MDYIKELGALALASRLRRLLDELQQNGKRIYKRLGIDFEIRWFTVFHFVGHNPKSSITHIANSLNLSHPTVIQVVNEMTQRRLLKTVTDEGDRRRRFISLTTKGKNLAKRLRPVWQAFFEIGKEITTESGNDFLKSINKMEASLKRQTLYDRILNKLELQEKGK